MTHIQQMTHEEIINEVISEFNFKRVCKVMKALKWFWADVSSEDGIPTKAELKKSVRDNLEYALKRAEMCCEADAEFFVATGGFGYRVNTEHGKIANVNVTFVIADLEFPC